MINIKYENSKTVKYNGVVGRAKDTETLGDIVVYEALYDISEVSYGSEQLKIFGKCQN